MTQQLVPTGSPVITKSYAIVKAKVYTVVMAPNFLTKESRSIPAQVGIPIVFPSVSPAVGKEHPREGSLASDETIPVKMVENDPTSETEHPAV